MVGKEGGGLWFLHHHLVQLNPQETGMFASTDLWYLISVQSPHRSLVWHDQLETFLFACVCVCVVWVSSNTSKQK